MGIIAKAIGTKVLDTTQLQDVGWHALRPSGSTTYEIYKSNDYENVYPSVSKIVNAFMVIPPFAINEKKDRVPKANAVEKLYHPNQQMSSLDFREALAVMYLIHPRTHILVWHYEDGVPVAGGEITPDNIAGYTFLENAVETTVKGVTTYNVNGNTFTNKEVITLKGMYPYDLSRGFAPTESAARWARIDDYIADYQAGFFKNGAIPSGQFIITASTTTEFNDIVDTMQSRHRGAGKNNNITYSHQPIDPNSGKPTDAQIKWIPFNVDNNKLDLGSVFEQVNQKLDSAYGVPASIRGVGENNNFATAQMDRRNFVENIVDPLAMKIWTRFTFELNRITGGLGYAITYDLELPSVSEDERVQAETNKYRMETVIAGVQAGFAVDAVVKAIDAPESFELLTNAYTPPEEADDMDVDTGDEVDDAPDQPAIGETISEVDKSSGKGEAIGTNPKGKNLSPEQETITEQQLYVVAKRLMEAQIDNALQDTKAIGDPTKAQLDEFVTEALKIITQLLIAQGQIEQAAQLLLIQQAGLESNVGAFNLSTSQVDRYRNYLRNVGNSYSSDTTRAIREVLERANIEGLTAQDIKRNLRELTRLEDYRVTRLARTETVRAGGNASLFSMEQINETVDATIYKVWTTTSSKPCPTCAALEGSRKPVNEAFVDAGGSVEGTDGGIYLNNFVAADIASIHPNDKCVITYEVVRND